MKFLNCTQHSLTPAQQAEAQREYQVKEFAELRDLNPTLFLHLAQIEPDADMEALADDLLDWLVEEARAEVVHLPIGSPGFMWVLSAVWHDRKRKEKLPRAVFSHSRRDAVDTPQPDGSVKKTQVFAFERFLAL